MPRKVRGKEVSKEGAMDEWKEKKKGAKEGKVGGQKKSKKIRQGMKE